MAGKALIFSDTHFSRKVDAPRLNYLKGVLSQADFVVINGDFWDSDLCTFEEFVTSGWKELFPILLRKNAFYIFGNHDPKHLSDERVALFSRRCGDAVALKAGRRELLIEHGHRIAASHNPLLDRIACIKLRSRPVGYWFLRLVAPFALKLLGDWAVRFRDWNGTKTIKRMVKKDTGTGQIRIFAHTHAAELDIANGYANSGFIDFGWAQYILAEGSRIRLIEERY